MIRNLYRIIVLFFLSSGLFSCQPSTKEEPSQVKLNEEENKVSIIKSSDNKTSERKVNRQLMLRDGNVLIDVEKEMTLFHFPEYLGEVELENPNDTTLLLKAKTNLPDPVGTYHVSCPIVVTVFYGKYHYTAFRDTKKESYPKWEKEDFDRIIHKLKDLKKDTLVTKVDQDEETGEQSEEEFEAMKKRMMERESRTVGYDDELTIAILNGCSACKTIFQKDWPEVLGDNLNGAIAEQHGWNEELIKEFERKLE